MVDELHMVESKKVSALNHEATEFLEIDYDVNDLYQVENMSIDKPKEEMEWRKRVIENRDKLIHIHDNEVKNIAECNLLHDIISPPKCAKNINSHYSPIIHRFMNTRKGRLKFRILWDSGCSSTIDMRRLVQKLWPETYAVMQWKTQTGNITINHKVDVELILPALIVTNVVTWKCHVDESAKGRYDMILGRNLLT